jgi:hypothetical protein
MTKEEILEKYPVHEIGNDYDFETFRHAIYMPFPEAETLEHDIYCKSGITFGKGGMPFHATLKQDAETKEPYLDILPYGSESFPHIKLPACLETEVPTTEAFRQKLESAVDKAFLDGRLDANLLAPHPYLNAVDDFDDFIEVLAFEVKQPEISERAFTQRDIGDIRMTIVPRGTWNDEQGRWVYNANRLDLELSIMKDPQLAGNPNRDEASKAVEALGFEIPSDIQKCDTSEAVRDFLNAQLTVIAKENPAIQKALESTEYRWMQYDLHDAQQLFPDGYFDHKGEFIDCERDMTLRQASQYVRVYTNALLEETPSKTLWLDLTPEEKENTPLTGYQLLGISKSEDSLPAFDIRLANGNEMMVYPEELFPSEMRRADCPYTEKEYGVSEALIPEPLEHRGIFGVVPSRSKQERKQQARPFVEQDVKELIEKIQKDFCLDAEDAVKLIHKAATTVQQKSAERKATGR